MDQYWCPLDDGDDFPGSTNCGGADFGTGLRRDLHYAQEHLKTGDPKWLCLTSGPAAYAAALCNLRPFVGSVDREFYGAPSVPGGSDWGMLGPAAGLGQGLPQALYVVWSQGTPIAWYLNDITDEGWVFPEGDYYKYDPITSRHQNIVGAALKLVDATNAAPLLGLIRKLAD